MKLGVCVGDNSENVKIAAEHGFDYVESCFSLLAEADREKFDGFKAALKESGITCEAVNCFLPGRLKTTGPDVDEAALAEYIEKGMIRGEELGVKTVVFGSSGSRTVPEGFDYAEAGRQLVKILREIIAPIAKKHGITVVLEPLSKVDTNIINTVKEGAAYAAMADSENVKLLGDLYHMCNVGDTEKDVLTVGSLLRHAHIAQHEGRRYPTDAAKQDYAPFLRALEQVGCPRCSIEAGCDDFYTDSKAALAVLKAARG